MTPTFDQATYKNLLTEIVPRVIETENYPMDDSAPYEILQHLYGIQRYSSG
jgi:hypothetical protein